MRQQENTFTYTHHNIILQGEDILSTLNDYVVKLNITTPVWITSSTLKIKRLHDSLWDSPLILFDNTIERAQRELFDSIIVYGGKKEIELCDTLYSSLKKDVTIFHILSSKFIGDEYTHKKGIHELILIDKKLIRKENKETIAQQLTILLFYLLSSVLETNHPITSLSLRHLLTKIVSATQDLKGNISLRQISYDVATLIPLVGEVHSNSNHSFIISLMENMVIKNLSSLYQSCSTLLGPLVRYIRHISPKLYEQIEEITADQSIEEICDYLQSCAPIGSIETVLQHTIVQLYNVILKEEKNTSFHHFLSFIDSREKTS